MARGKARGALSEAELDVLKVLWEGGPGTVRRLNEQLTRRGRRWAYTTVLTLLHRLQSKGWVATDASSAAHVFRATGTRNDWLETQLQSLADQAFDGNSVPLVLALVQKARFAPEELARFRSMIDQLRPDAKPK